MRPRAIAAGRLLLATTTRGLARVRAGAPLAAPATGLAAGIALDRAGTPLGSKGWAVLALGAGLAAGWSWAGRGRPALLLAAIVALGAGWHHHQVAERPADDLARFGWSHAEPVLLRGVIADVPEARAEGPETDRLATRLALDVTRVSPDGRRWQPASGRVLVTVAGPIAALGMGAAVEVAGRLEAVRGPLNPGETDRRDRLRAQGIALRLGVDGPEGLRPDPTGAGSWSGRLLGRLRVAAADRLLAGLGPDADAAPLAAALLLGRREGVDPEVNDAFARTGTAHLLAISGLHMQALALVVGLGLTALGLGRKPTALVVVLTTLGYAVLVGGAPSVVRSAVMTVVAGLAVLADRPARVGNLLAAAALVTLGLQPSALFDVGAQLSFLAVMALVWAVPPVARTLGLMADSAPPETAATDPEPGLSVAERLDAVERHYEPRWRRRTRGIVRSLALALVASTVVWAVTLPLVVLRFHLIPLVGIVLNVVLVPLSTPTLAAGGLTLALAWIAPPLAAPAGWLCAALLDLTEWLVRLGAALPGGHQFAAGPGPGWVLGFYGLLAALALSRASGPRAAWLATAGLAGWIGLGLLAALRPPPVTVPEAEVLAVDHGLAVLIRSPAGGAGAWLYDCGRMRDPHVGRRLIAPALWARGVRRLDGVILSHADFDHYGGLPELLERLSVGVVLVPPGFADGPGSDPHAQAVLDACRARGVPVQTLAAGARLDLGSGLTATVRHPPAAWSARDPSDNARSLVVDLAHGGRHLWLTGDLDGPGLDALLATTPPAPIDGLLAPHHGGRTANPPRLYDWARPRFVIASQRRPPDGLATPDALDPLAARGLPVYRTWRTGALRLRWTPTGLTVEPFLKP